MLRKAGYKSDLSSTESNSSAHCEPIPVATERPADSNLTMYGFGEPASTSGAGETTSILALNQFVVPSDIKIESFELSPSNEIFRETVLKSTLSVGGKTYGGGTTLPSIYVKEST